MTTGNLLSDETFAQALSLLRVLLEQPAATPAGSARATELLDVAMAHIRERVRRDSDPDRFGPLWVDGPSPRS